MANAYFCNAFSFNMVDTTKEGQLVYHPFTKDQIVEFFQDEGSQNEYIIVPAVNSMSVARRVADDLGLPISKIYGGPGSDEFILKKGELMVLVHYRGMHYDNETLPEGGQFEYMGVKFK